MTFMPTLPRLTERAWMAQVLTLARMFSWRWWHDRATNATRGCSRCRVPWECPRCHQRLKPIRNDPGWPDLFLVRGDTLIIAELKSDRNYPTPEQKEWLEALGRVKRVVVVVWKPKDTDRVVEVMR